MKNAKSSFEKAFNEIKSKSIEQKEQMRPYLDEEMKEGFEDYFCQFREELGMWGYAIAFHLFEFEINKAKLKQNQKHQQMFKEFVEKLKKTFCWEVLSFDKEPACNKCDGCEMINKLLEDSK